MHGAGSICLVANELANLGRTGGIGSSNWELAHLLAADGWRTHVLYTQTGDETAALDRIRKQLSCAGIGFTALDEVPLSPETSLPGWPFIDELDVSERVCEALPQLDRTHCFDLIQFADWQGVGFRTIQAKQAGLILPNARIIVCSHGMSAWARDAAGRWPSADDLLLEHAEQQTFEMADFQVAPTQYILDYARSIGWNVRDDAQVVRNPLPTPISNTQHISANISDTLPQLVFFGRLDRHKGLILILEALREVDPAIPISFLGRDTVLADGRIAMELIHRQLIGRKIEFHTDMGREEAIRYLSGANRLALIPSIMENYPNTVLECAANGIPFLASRVGGIPEIVKDPQLNLALLFEPTKADLCRSLKNWLELTPSARQDICNRLRNDLSTETHNSEIAKSYRGFLETGADCSVNSSRTPLVSIAVTYFNLGRFLPETLRSLARQTYSQCEILILNDGSTDPASQRIFAEQEKLYPKFRFIHQTNTGLCGARNKLLEEARGEYFLPCDADDIAAPDLVERLVIALERCQNLSASAVYYLGFHDASGSVSANDISAKDTSTNGIRANDTSANDNRTNDISANATTAERSFAWAYRPTGGPLLIGGQANCWGGPSTMYRTEVLRSIGGYRDHQNCNIEDWHLHAKLASLGHKIGVVPRPLIFYRERPESMFRTVDQYTGHRFVMNDALLSTPLTANQLRDLWGTLALSGQHSDRLWGQAKSEKKHSEVLLEQLREAHQQMTQLHDQIAQLSRDNAKMTERCIEQQNHDDEEVEDVECLHNQSNLVPANDSMKSPRIWNLFARRSQLRNPILRHKTELPTSAKQKKTNGPASLPARAQSWRHFAFTFPYQSISCRLDLGSSQHRSQTTR